MESKCWGTTREVFYSRQCSVHWLAVEAGWRCSRHIHAERANRFVVLSGVIVVRRWDASGETAVTLRSGDVYDVPSGVLHRFEVVDSGTVIEIYWPDVRGGAVRRDDIVREDQGGPL